MKSSAILSGAAALLMSVVPARAQSCASLVGEYTTWLTRTTVGGVPEAIPTGFAKAVGFTIATNQRTDQNERSLPLRRNSTEASLRSVNVVSYGIGNLRALSSGGVTRLDGVGQFVFSDRLRDPGSVVFTGFHAGQSETIGVNVDPNGTVRITLRAWGNTVVTIPMQCENGVMFGFGAAVGGSSRPAMYVISFAKQFIPA